LPKIWLMLIYLYCSSCSEKFTKHNGCVR